MNTWIARSLAVGSTVVTLAAGAALSARAAGWPSTAAPPPDASTTTATATTTDAATAALLRFGREEERMARDLYRGFSDRYADAPVFARIATSEQRHYEAVGALLTRHGVTDPSTGRSPGSYADPTLQRLYDAWLARGSRSLDEAYAAAEELEQRDIADLTSATTKTTALDVRQVLSQLQRASEHHLAAFRAAAAGDPTGGPNRAGRGDGGMMGPGVMGGTGPGMRGWGAADWDGTCPMADATDATS